MKYIDAEKIRSAIESEADNWQETYTDCMRDNLLTILDSLQQEPIPDTDVLHTKLVNLLKTYRIGEETAITLADRIADTYGAQRYMGGLCDGVKQEQPEVELEKEIDAVWNPRFNLGWDEHSCLTMNRAGFESFAYHFYELGLNARKEE